MSKKAVICGSYCLCLIRAVFRDRLRDRLLSRLISYWFSSGFWFRVFLSSSNTCLHQLLSICSQTGFWSCRNSSFFVVSSKSLSPWVWAIGSLLYLILVQSSSPSHQRLKLSKAGYPMSKPLFHSWATLKLSDGSLSSKIPDSIFFFVSFKMNLNLSWFTIRN